MSESPFQIPESAFPKCIECGAPIRHDSALVLHEIVGFERERAQGGTNHVVARRRTGRLVGSCCSGRVQAGLGRQESLLEEEV